MIASGHFATLLSMGAVGAGCLAMGEKLIPIVPSYALLVFIGMTIIPDPHILVLTIMATAAGSTAGSLCWYAAGRAIGPVRIAAVVCRFGRYVFLSPSLYRRMADAYRRNDSCVTALGQVIPTVRIFLPLPAGAIGLNAWNFLLATMLGSLAWNTPLLTLGYLLRNTGHDPIYVGLLALCGLIATELVVLVALRVGLGVSLLARYRAGE
jgi:membrane protein DedA with SNARE-associated domain